MFIFLLCRAACVAFQVMSGQLKWGPVHTEKFWREQARKFEADEFFVLKQVNGRCCLALGAAAVRSVKLSAEHAIYCTA